MSPDGPPATAPVRLVRGRHGAVASPHHLATQAGLATLRAGGSAVDAAIATNAALAVVAGHSCGLGGDAFWLIWDAPAGAALALNGSGRAGSGASIEAVRAAGLTSMPLRGPWSVTVPGAVRSWGDAHARFGRLPWASLLEPAIDLAEAFPASTGWLEAVETATAVFGVSGDWARIYRPPHHPRRPGGVVRLPALATTMRRLADEGPADFYSGALAGRTADYFGERGVPVDAADLAAHSSDWAEPLGIDYRGLRSLSHPPNSVGVIALQTLGILQRFAPPRAAGFDGEGWHEPTWVHLGLEASRLALAERDAHVTDHSAMRDGEVEEMLSAGRLDELAGRLDPERALGPRPGTLPAGGGTVHIATADRWGGLVSMLESNYQGFGSGLVDPATGIAFHDRGAFFSLDPHHPNSLAPRKRTVHTLAPGMLLREDRPAIAHGSMGGEIQPQVFAQFVSAVVDGAADIATAVAAPRWAARIREHLGAADLTELEARAPSGLAEALASMGHEVVMAEAWSSTMGHANAVEIIRSKEGEVSFAAAADPRSEGSAAAC